MTHDNHDEAVRELFEDSPASRASAEQRRTRAEEIAAWSLKIGLDKLAERYCNIDLEYRHAGRPRWICDAYNSMFDAEAILNVEGSSAADAVSRACARMRELG